MSTQEKLIQAGLDLFHKHGIHPVGLDRILQQAGVTKTTFYNHFESKETFACAVIDRFGAELLDRIQTSPSDPTTEQLRRKLSGVFEAWDRLSTSKSFRGCMLIAAGVASGDENDPARQAAILNKGKLLKAYEHLAIQAKISNPQHFARCFSVLVDGALVARHLCEDREAFTAAQQMAESLIDSSLPGAK